MPRWSGQRCERASAGRTLGHANVHISPSSPLSCRRHCQELEADVRRFFFKTRPFASLLEEASKGDRPTGPAMDVVDQVMAVLGLALLLKLVFVLLALVQ